MTFGSQRCVDGAQRTWRLIGLEIVFRGSVAAYTRRVFVFLLVSRWIVRSVLLIIVLRACIIFVEFTQLLGLDVLGRRRVCHII